MRHVLSAVVLTGTLVAAPSLGFASPAAAKPANTVAPKSTKSSAATHSTVGVVKSLDANELVLTRKGKKPGDVTFTLDPSTNKQGDIAVGSPVSVRYRMQGKSHVATAVSVRQSGKTAKASKAAKSPKR